MGVGFPFLRNVTGLSFFKLLGTGAGQGFSLAPLERLLTFFLLLAGIGLYH